MAEAFRPYAEWENGQSGPTYPQLEGLADKLKVPVAVFFFPEPPRTPAIEETFRTLPDAVLDELPSRMRLLLRKAKAFQLNIAELCNDNNPAPRLITRDLSFDVASEVPIMAREVREYLRISIGEQIQWRSDDEALKNWRDLLQGVGIFTFKDSFDAPEFSGFCLTDPVFPIIYVNNSNAKTRQTFTLFHELAHLLFSTSGIDSDVELTSRPGNAARIEVICNAFAAEFLLPATVFDEARLGLPATAATAELLAARYHVSRESVFRRFLDRGEITRQTYEAISRQWSEQRRQGSGGDYYRTKLVYLGRPYVSIALSAYRQNRINEVQLAQYLDMKPRNVSGLEERFLSGAAAV
jgi:Zn-dependent peptidase ImmA (M78 family)